MQLQKVREECYVPAYQSYKKKAEFFGKHKYKSYRHTQWSIRGMLKRGFPF